MLYYHKIAEEEAALAELNASIEDLKKSHLNHEGLSAITEVDSHISNDRSDRGMNSSGILTLVGLVIELMHNTVGKAMF